MEINTGFDPERAREDFLPYKIHAKSTPLVTLTEFAADLLVNYKDQYPDFAILMAYFMSVPLNSATCERGFSAQNLVKTKLRNRLTEERQNELLRVSLNGPCMAKFDYANSAEKFRAMRNRMK